MAVLLERVMGLESLSVDADSAKPRVYDLIAAANREYINGSAFTFVLL